ncbi:MULTISPECIES: TVP38/TMEM64 family protein [Vibrio]|uniref:TVP38/TMEM64 family membrane protein n=1 Tax=Vibrio algicola TaxID=2662262 RepID=A0A5Q0TBM1_9VIBR|nr:MULTISPECIES: VTT domain-containing protein [Vibrio]MBD1576540.1 VTT domain-containing protein [Vibrio sp. S11_S32]
MKWLKLAALIVIILLLISQLNNPVIAHIADKNWLVDYIGQNGIKGDVILLVTSIFFLAISGPKQVIALVFGYLYHIYLGTLLTIAVCVVAASINYTVAHFLLANILFKRFPNRMRKFNAFASRAPFTKILLLRLFPIGNNVVTNVLSGSVRVPLVPFFCASILGYLPQTIIFVLAGAGIKSPDSNLIYVSVGLGVVSTILTSLIYRDHVKQQVESLNQESNLDEAS